MLTTLETAPAPRPTPRGSSVLVVDDGDDNCLLLQRILEHAGYQVTIARNGSEGLAQLELYLPDIVLLDYMMPLLNGEQVLRQIRGTARTADLPVIMLTASTMDEHIDAALAAGATDYMTKPFDRRILLARIEATIGAARVRGHLRQSLESKTAHDALLHDLGEAAQVQRARLPATPCRVSSWTLAGGLVAGFHVGGDGYDLLSAADGTPIVTLIDVSGHGMAAALVAAWVLSNLRALCSSHPLPEAMKLLNTQLMQEGANKYACVGAIELRGDHALVLNAGLPPISVIRGGVCVARLEGSGPPPGLLHQAEYALERSEIQPGDRLVMMSDGLTEPFGLADHTETSLGRLLLLGGQRAIDELTPDLLQTDINRLLAGVRAEDRDDATIVIAEQR